MIESDIIYGIKNKELYCYLLLKRKREKLINNDINNNCYTVVEFDFGNQWSEINLENFEIKKQFENYTYYKHNHLLKKKKNASLFWAPNTGHVTTTQRECVQRCDKGHG